MRNIYLCEPNCMIHKNGAYLTVRKEGCKLMDLSLTEVNALFVFGNTQLTTQAITMIAERGIDIVYLTQGGTIKAKVLSENKSSVVTRIAQYHTYFDSKRRLEIAKYIVMNKVSNQEEILRKYQRELRLGSYDDLSKKLHAGISHIARCNDVSELMGIEGSCATEYFQLFTYLLGHYGFVKREQRPCYDVVNSLLNLTYAFLKNEMLLIGESISLDMQLGFLHSIRVGRDSLIYDLMEPFRPIFADQFVITMFRTKQFQQKDFEMQEQGMRLKQEAIKRYCKLFTEYLYEHTYHGETWITCMEQFVRKFKLKLLGED